MSFIYNRKISVRRSKTNAAGNSVGLVDYSGRAQSTLASDPEGEIILLRNVPASIQARGVGRVMRDLLPGGITSHPQWRIFIPARNVKRYSIRDNDIVVDDEGYRYQVAQNYWNSLGYRLDCVRLES